MKKCFRAAALVLLLALVTGLFAGCGSAEDQRMQTQLFIYDYDEVDTGLGEEDTYFNSIVIGPERVWTTSYRYDETGSHTLLLTAKVDGTDARTVELPLQQVDTTNGGSDLSGIAIAPNGNVCVMEQVYFYGTEEKNWEDFSEQFFIHHLDAEGNHLSSAQLQTPPDTWLNPYNMVAANDGTCYTSAESTIIAIAPDGNCRLLPEFTDGGYVDRLISMADGSLLVLWSGDENGDWVNHVAPLDPVTGTLGEELPLPQDKRYTPILADPAGKLYLYDNWGIYAFDPQAGTANMICSWLDSDVDYGTSVAALAAREDGSFVTAGFGSNWNDLLVASLTYVDPATLPEKTVLTVACYYGYEMQQAALKFNRASDTVRITVRQYADYDTEENNWTGAITQMNTDIVTGNIPDILLVDAQLPFHNYVNKGLFTDLYPLLDAAESPVKRQDILPNILTAFETDGRLTSITDGFTLATFAADAQLVGSEPGWTWQEFFDLLDAHPEIESAFNKNLFRRDLLNYVLMMGGDQFVNYETGECRFDSPAFQQVLELIANYPTEYDPDREFEAPKDLYSTHRCLMYMTHLYDFDYVLRENNYIFNNNICYIGMPTIDGTGGSAIQPSNRFAISEACPDKAAAWEYVSSFLTYEYQTESIYCLPVRTDAMDKKVEAAMDPETHGDYGVMPGGIYKEAASTMSPALPDDSEAHYDRPTTQAEVDQAMQVITGTTTLYHMDNKLVDIIMEEAEAFFAGSKTAAETASIIQNRATTYLAESR